MEKVRKNVPSLRKLGFLRLGTSGMIPRLGRGGHGFDSRLGPYFFLKTSILLITRLLFGYLGAFKNYLHE